MWVLVYTAQGTFAGKIKTASPLTLEEPCLLVPEAGKGKRGFRPQPVPVKELVFYQYVAYGPMSEAMEREFLEAKVELQGIKVARPAELDKVARLTEQQKLLRKG